MNILIFPLLLLLIFLGLFLVNVLKPRINLLMSWRRNAILAGVYLLILILTIPALHLLPDKGFITFQETMSPETTILPNEAYDLFMRNALTKEDLDRQPGLYQNSYQKFKSDFHYLEIDIPKNPVYNPLYLERKNVDDGNIEVYSYITHHSLMGIDLTEQILPPDISYTNGIITINPTPQEQRIDYTRFKTDFTTNQFKGSSNEALLASPNFGWKMILIRVPKSMEVEQRTNNIIVNNS